MNNRLIPLALCLALAVGMATLVSGCNREEAVSAPRYNPHIPARKRVGYVR